MRLEVLVLPVADIDRAKDFYDKIGFKKDLDYSDDEGYKIVQYTPPGSGASIIFGTEISVTASPVQNVLLVVSDIEEARATLIERGVDVGEIYHDSTGIFHHAEGEHLVPGVAPERSSYGSYASFSDPDGNGWVLQEVTNRLPGHEALY